MKPLRKKNRPTETSVLRRSLMLVLLVLLGYLGEVCVMPYIRIFGVSPNLLYVIIGIVTVAYGKLRAFWVGVTFGLLMEIMQPTVTYLNLALYSLTTLFCSFGFADKPLKTLEYERAVNRERRELAPWTRTVLCVFVNIFVYETVRVAYIYLGGWELTVGHFLRAFTDVAATTGMTLLLAFPLRLAILGRKADSRRVEIAPVVFSQK